MRLKYLFIAISLLLIGCSNHEITTEEFPPSLSGSIILNGNEHPMEKGGYRWERRTGLETEVVTTDHLSPYQMAQSMEPILVIPGQEVEIKIEENPIIHVYLWYEKGRVEEIGLHNNKGILSSNKGNQVYEVVAEWKNGTISYTFVVDIQ